MGKLRDLAVDRKKSVDGIPVDFGGITFYVARNGNPLHREALRRLAGERRRQGRVDEKTVQSIEREAFALGCIRGWQEMEDEDGSEIPFSQETAVAIMTDEEYDPVYGYLASVAIDADQYRSERIVETAGN